MSEMRQHTLTTENPDLRCCCGSLMARWTSRGVELKCRRCKRICTLVFEEGGVHCVWI